MTSSHRTIATRGAFDLLAHIGPGKLVDVATYVTRDHNMDSMHAMKAGWMSADHMTSGTAPKSDSMAGAHMGSTACPARKRDGFRLSLRGRYADESFPGLKSMQTSEFGGDFSQASFKRSEARRFFW